MTWCRVGAWLIGLYDYLFPRFVTEEWLVMLLPNGNYIPVCRPGHEAPGTAQRYDGVATFKSFALFGQAYIWPQETILLPYEGAKTWRVQDVRDGGNG